VPDATQSHFYYSPRQQRLLRRINNWLVYRTIRAAIRDCNAELPVLMAPCGYGWFFPRFRQDGIEVAGIDIDPAAIKDARTLLSPPFRAIEGSLLEMPFKDGEFDFVVNNRFMPHFEEDFRLKAFKELARVTRRYLLVHYDVMSLRQVFRKLAHKQKPQRANETIEGWRKTQRKARKLLFTREMMETEGAAGGFRLKAIYHVLPVFSDRAYALYEKK
jgi:SAM-dependent methyltransferase